MEMKDADIVRKFTRNGAEDEQIDVLAQLNACNRDDIIAILVRAGYERTDKGWKCKGKEVPKVRNVVKKKKTLLTDERINMIKKLKSQQYTTKNIAEIVGVSVSTVSKVLKNNTEKQTAPPTEEVTTIKKPKDVIEIRSKKSMPFGLENTLWGIQKDILVLTRRLQELKEIQKKLLNEKL